MKKISEYFDLFFILFLLNISFCYNNYDTYLLETEINEDGINIMNFKDTNKLCNNFIPSLLFPIILAGWRVDERNYNIIDSVKLLNPIFYHKHDYFAIDYMGYEQILMGYNVGFGIERFYELNDCYFGLLYKNIDYISLNESYFLLNQLKESKQIERRVFSFDKWTINDNSIYSHFYFGGIHENFLNNGKGIVGSCEIDKESSFWGCNFNSIIINNKIASLTKENNELYKIYFSSETYEIFMPNSFENKFNNLTDNKCTYDKDHVDEIDYFLFCNDFFVEKDYIHAKLINQNMSITIEIDSMYRFTNNEEQRGRTRIRYHDIDYFIFPLIMFKNFHVQFDGENNLISFYTLDSSILEVMKEKKNEPKGSSKVLLSFIIIIIILAIAIIGFVIYRYLRKKKEDDVQKDIKKIEDIEEFHSMD